MPQTNVTVFADYSYISKFGKNLCCSSVHPSRSCNIYYEKKNPLHLVKIPSPVYFLKNDMIKVSIAFYGLLPR